ncbi:MAG: HEAT repeat domain-containing protein [Verrucomicrobiota bacterium]
MLRRRFPWWLRVVVVAVVLTGLAVAWSRREPRHQGKPFSQWFDQSLQAKRRPVPESWDAIVVGMAEKAVPHLAARARKESRLEKYYREQWPKLPAWLRGRGKGPQPRDAERLLALELLAMLGPKAKSAIPDLLPILGETNALSMFPVTGPARFTVNANGVVTINTSKGPFQGVLVPGTSNTPATFMPMVINTTPPRLAAAKALVAMGSDEPQIIEALLAEMRAYHPNTVSAREAASTALLYRSPDRAKEVLIPAVSDANENVRLVAVSLLAATQKKDGRTVRALAHALRDANWLLRQRAADALAGAELEYSAVVPALVSVLNDRDESVRRSAAVSLEKIRTRSPLPLRELTAALQSPDARLRAGAAEALAQFGPPAAESLPVLRALVGALGIQDEYLRHSATARLKEIQARSALPVQELTAALQSSDARLRAGAAEALTQFGAGAAQALPPLRGLTDSEDSPTAHQAGLAIWAISSDAGPLIEFRLRALLAGEQPEWNLVLFMRDLGAEPKPAIPQLVEAMRHPDAQARQQLARVLQELGVRPD